jgi:hypothetical protein
MGLFKRMLPKPMRQARRAMHPVSMMTPRPVRNVKRAAAKTINPIGALGDAIENEVVRAVRGGKKKRRTSGSSQLRDDAYTGGYAYDDPVDARPMSDAEEREYLGFKPLTLKTALQGETLKLVTEDGSTVAVTVTNVLDPAVPRAEYDVPAHGQRLVAVQLAIENEGPGVFAYAPTSESKLIGSNGGDYQWRRADLDVPTFNDVVRLTEGSSRSAYVCYAVGNEDQPETVEIVFGVDLKAEIGQWKITSATPPGGYVKTAPGGST